MLERIDAGDSRAVDLDNAAWQVWQRLSAEWHVAILERRRTFRAPCWPSYLY